MKIVLLSGASSIHTIRWANGLSHLGHDVHVISQHSPIDPFSVKVTLHKLPNRGTIGYFTMVPAVRRLLKQIKPDIVNAHYASGYGTTARLVGYSPWVLSVWGSDVYDFPHKSPVHKWLVKKNLRAADQVASTSKCMAHETKKLVPELTKIFITPFGVELADYDGVQASPPVKKAKLVIGTVKTMKPKYGIDTLIEAYALLVDRMMRFSEDRAIELELRLIGGGEQTPALKALASRLGVSNTVIFVGHVPHKSVPQELSQLDIYVALSRLDSESFGVAIIEAGAAGRPVVVSDAGGLPEVTIEGKTGFVVPRENPQAASEVLERLVLDEELRFSLGREGKKHVTEHYSWDACVSKMVKVYEETIETISS